MGNMIGKRYSSEFATCDTRNLDYSKHRHPEAVHVVYPQIQMEGPGDSTMVKCDPNVDRPAFLLWLYTSFKADITISCPVRLITLHQIYSLRRNCQIYITPSVTIY